MKKIFNEIHFTKHYFTTFSHFDALINSDNVNIYDDHGATMLHYAAWYGNYELCVLLLKRGANVNAPDMDFDYPLKDSLRRRDEVIAKRELYEKISKLLLDHGGRITTRPYPAWFQRVIKKRNKCRLSTIIFIYSCPFGKDVARHIGKHIWSFRMTDLLCAPRTKAQPKYVFGNSFG